AIGEQAAETLGGGFHAEQGGHGYAGAPAVGRRPRRSQRDHGSESRPVGRNAAITTMMRPYTIRSMPRPASGPVPTLVLIPCESGMRTPAPSTGPHSLPMPPTTVAMIGSVLQLISSTCSGKTESAQNA